MSVCVNIYANNINKERKVLVMTKATLIQMLSILPDDAAIDAEFNFSRPYSSPYSSKIVGVTINVGNDCSAVATLKIKEAEEDKADAA